MPARNETPARRRRRELLRALLEEEEQADSAAFTEAEMVGLLRELRGAQAPRPLGGLMSPEQLQGFMWGVGAAALLLMVLPQAKQVLRPFAVSTMKGAMELMDQLKGLMGQAGEGLQDLVAEAQFERMQAAAAPDPPPK
ncbi:MAG TPA: DUF5132 domain-containing protein [Symbiobacteriaceae bacterium]|jgi:hypothetical protein